MVLGIDNKVQNTCIECGLDQLVFANGYLVCSNCGTINQETYITNKSFYNQSIHGNSQHAIGKSIEFVGSLGSQIDYENGFMKDWNGNRLNSKIVYKYRRLQRNHQNRSRFDGNTTHLRTMLNFNKIIQSLEIKKDIKLRALYLYWKHVNSSHKITNHMLLIALCLLQAIREAKERAPYRFSEIINVFQEYGHRVTNKNILRLARDLNVRLSPNKRKSEDYISRITNQIRFEKEVNLKISSIFTIDQYLMLLEYISIRFLSKIDRRERGGVQPYPFAVSIVYLADRIIAKAINKKHILTQEKLAKIADSAEFTIRDHVYRFLGKLYKEHEYALVTECKKQMKNNNIYCKN